MKEQIITVENKHSYCCTCDLCEVPMVINSSQHDYSDEEYDGPGMRCLHCQISKRTWKERVDRGRPFERYKEPSHAEAMRTLEDARNAKRVILPDIPINGHLFDPHRRSDPWKNWTS